MNAVNKLVLFTNSQISIIPLMINFAVVVILSLLLKYFYIRYGHALSNRRIFANNFSIIAATTFLVITIIKSSLALSLGLVGALSIVRFRAPIKEPEELAYLFLTIAIGLGMGADQMFPTIIVVLLILFVIVRWQGMKKTAENHNLYLNIEIPKIASEKDALKQIDSILKEHSNIIDIRRVDMRDNILHATYYVDFDNNELLMSVLENLKKSIPNVAITFIDQDRETRG
ncbi:MAG: DUF4956 domain-containing protein [Candidatus Omnitrophica bacterium]|nr:DUF4956 domain-containing protein [Candidatus Omnitrophota bacterium]MDD5352445.1 DUF4956 domain-containing protein [Candidatus Omnitrophota bacterium]MDD5550043.1 DUF4956 domain-containing protein [Candidatus Omnitrophota bacterium]